MAGSVTVTYSAKAEPSGTKIKIVNVAWTGDAANGTVPDTVLVGLYGKLVKAITNPGAVAPTANYNIKILDAEDNTSDCANGGLLTRHTTNTEQIFPLAPPLFCGDYTFNLTGNVVNSATGVCILFIEES